MFLPGSRRLLEVEGSDVFINFTSVSSTISGSDANVGLFSNSSYNASGEGVIDFGESDFGKCLSFLDIFRPKGDEVTWEWRILHNEELNDLYPSPNIVRVIKSRRIRWAGHVALMGKGRGVYRILVENP
jgi:hypothetical protein